MDSHRFSGRMRPWIAMSAAYALALQLLLTVALAAQHAAWASAGFCVTSDAADPASPPQKTPCSVGVLAASDPGPSTVALTEPQRDYGAVQAPVSIPAASLFALATPRLSQGPPRIA